MKIDVTKISGYENMTTEEKLKALEELEIKQDFSGYVKKEVYDKIASEASNFKKQLRDKQSEEEKEKAAREEEQKAMQEELAKLREEKAITEFTNRFLKAGYDEELATKSANALYKNDYDTLFANQVNYQETLIKKEKENALLKTPKPGNGGTDKTITKEQFKAMSLEEKTKLYSENKDLYDKLKGE